MEYLRRLQRTPQRARLLAGIHPGWSDIGISSVDGFQGREKAVIIFSSVRSNEHGRIGFLADLRRFNVAATRAKQKFIVIGNAATLRKAQSRSGTLGGTSEASAWREWIRWVEAEGLLSIRTA